MNPDSAAWFQWGWREGAKSEEKWTKIFGRPGLNPRICAVYCAHYYVFGWLGHSKTDRAGSHSCASRDPLWMVLKLTNGSDQNFMDPLNFTRHGMSKSFAEESGKIQLDPLHFWACATSAAHAIWQCKWLIWFLDHFNYPSVHVSLVMNDIKEGFIWI